MKINVTTLLIVLFFLSQPIAGSEFTIKIKSLILSNKVAVTVILPHQYKIAEKNYPSIYLMHGFNGDNHTWKRVAPLQKFADSCEVLFICADASNSWYVDSPIKSGCNYESFFIKELIPFIDSSYKTIRDRNGRALCGISMGGHGALTLISKHPDMFIAASSICGIMDLGEFHDRWELTRIFGPYENNPQSWYKNSFVSLYKNLKGTGCAIFIDCGLSDFALTSTRIVDSLLNNSGIAHEYYERPGSHTLEYPARVFKDHMVFLLGKLGAQEHHM